MDLRRACATSPTAGACSPWSLIFLGVVVWALPARRQRLPATHAAIPFKHDDRRTEHDRSSRASRRSTDVDRPAPRPPATSGTASRSSTLRCRAGGCGPSTPDHRLGARLRRRSIPAWPLITAATAGPARLVQPRRRRRGRWPRPSARAGRTARAASRTTAARRDPRRRRADAASPSRGGRSAFKVNCVQCHGSGAAGCAGLSQPQRRRLAVGRHARRDRARRSPTASAREPIPTRACRRCRPSARRHPDAGADRRTSPHIVLSLSGRRTTPPHAARRQAIFAEQLRRLPRRRRARATASSARRTLTDAIWLYGGDRAAIIAPDHASRGTA